MLKAVSSKISVGVSYFFPVRAIAQHVTLLIQLP
jgi:hypothetical protein